jgi:PadR family transcriptional regulator, regulatory protein PadR
MVRPASKNELLPGTLEMLILQTLTRGAMHGYGIAQHIQEITDDVLQVEEGSLYPALQRLLLKGWVKGEWGTSDNNRRARYYTLTAAGRKQLGIEAENFNRLIEAIARVMQTA